MPKISVRIGPLDADARSQLEYSLAFTSKDLLSYSIDDAESLLTAEVASEEACREVERKIVELVQRYEQPPGGLPKNVEFSHHRDLPIVDAWLELLERKWVTPVGNGHVILRGDAAKLLSLIDSRIQRTFVESFRAELEVYPPTILCETLDRCNHFTSFPEHIDFVAHLEADLDILNQFSEACRESGWSASHHVGRMAAHDFAISPSCCYHCYEGMEGWRLEGEGRCVTAVLSCHRHEGSNHRALSRLKAFTMRELIWVGHPEMVLSARARAEQLVVAWARDWELVGTLETANDMFFTKDYSTKASFQRQQQAKKELRLTIPAEQQSISVFSSNFHATTFGKAFNITLGGRPATSGCIGWGYERWVYAIFSQFGLDWEKWPSLLRDEFATHLRAENPLHGIS